MLPVVTAMFIQCRNVRSLAARVLGEEACQDTAGTLAMPASTSRLAHRPKPQSGSSPKKALASVRRSAGWADMAPSLLKPFWNFPDAATKSGGSKRPRPLAGQGWGGATDFDSDESGALLCQVGIEITCMCTW